MIILTYLGTGSAFCEKNYQTNAIIETSSGYKLLVDCGGDIRFSLAEQGLSYKDIDGVYISHLHADHIGGLEYLAFSTYFDPSYRGKPDLYISEFLIDDLWNRSLSGGLGSLQNKRATLDTYFCTHPVEKNGSFQAGIVSSTEFKLIQMIHFVNGFTFELSFGLMFSSGKETVFLTTDTQYAPKQIQDFYNEATVIFHDTETSLFPSGIHAHFDELTKLDEKTRNKMYLVHFQDGVITEPDSWDALVKEHGFRGFVHKGDSFKF